MRNFNILNLFCILSSILLFTLVSCSSESIQIKQQEQSEQQNQQSDIVTGYDNILSIGDSFYSDNLSDGNGKIEVTITDARIYNSLCEAGIALNDTFDYTLIDGINYDKKNDNFLDNDVLLVLTFNIKNIDAKSESHKSEPELYGEYDFRADALGGCTESNRIYFSNHDKMESHYYAFNLMPDETIQFDFGYLVHTNSTPLDKIYFETAATPENGTIVDLKLGEIK